MSYRSKRTMAQMTEADVTGNANANATVTDVPPVTLTSLSRSGATDEKWGPFCPKKNKVSADMTGNANATATDVPPVTISLSAATRSGATDERWGPFCPKKNKVSADVTGNGNATNATDVPPVTKSLSAAMRSGATKAPFSRTQINPTFEKPPNCPGSRNQISHNFQKHAATYSNPSFTTNTLLSKTRATINSHELTARKAFQEHAAKYPNPSFTTNPLLSKAHATTNSVDLDARKALQLSAKQLHASQKTGEQVESAPNSFHKKITSKLDPSFTTNPVLSKTHATTNSHASQKTGEQAQVGVKQPAKSDRSLTSNPLLSKTHATPNSHEPANKKAPEPSDVLWKNSPSNSGTNTSRVSLSQPTCSVTPAFSLSQPTCPAPSDIVGTTNNGSNAVDKSLVEPREEVLNQQDANQTSLKTFKPRRRSVVHDWPDNVEFDESEEVLVMDGEGNITKVNDSIQPHDVWYAKNVRYCVTFNEFHQPLKKGGHILVRFIGDMARKEAFCPIRDTNWHHVPEKFKVDIIKCIREHFVLPDGDGYDKGILKRVGKSVRQYRHDLKKAFFIPTTKTREEIYQSVPGGIPRDSWIHLVDYWYSEKGKRFAECGKEARASQNHVHTTGSTSYADIRAEFEEKNKREPTELEVFKQTHKRRDGSYVKDTVTEEFVLDADTYILSELATNPTKPKVQIQNEAFSKLMYGDDVPKRPLGYGFGVKRSDVFGVHSIFRKEAFKLGDTSSLTLENMEKTQNLEKAVHSLTKDKKELETKLNETNIILYKILEGMSSGMPSPEIAQLAKSTLNSQISDSTNGGSASR